MYVCILHTLKYTLENFKISIASRLICNRTAINVVYMDTPFCFFAGRNSDFSKNKNLHEKEVKKKNKD